MRKWEQYILENPEAFYRNKVSDKFGSEFNPDEFIEQIHEGQVYIYGTLYKMKEITFADHYSFVIPEHFEEMSEESKICKYPYVNHPQIIYTDPTTTIDITFTQSNHEVYEHNFERFVYNVLDIIQNSYPNGKINSKGVEMISENQVGYFDFISSAFDKNVYNFMFIFRNNAKAVFATLNCPEKNRDLWKPMAYVVMLSKKEREEAHEKQYI